MKIAVSERERKVLIINDGGDLLGKAEVSHITSRTLGRLAVLCETELYDRAGEPWSKDS